MFKIKYLYSLIIVLVIFSCSDNNSRYPGYTVTPTGLYYKLQSFGEGQRKPAAGDYLELMITYKTENDSVFMDTYSKNDMGMVILPFNHSSFQGGFEEGLALMNEGDSVSFIVDAEKLFTKFFKTMRPSFITANGIVKMDVKLHRILNEVQYSEELKRYKMLVEDRDIEEQREIHLFIDTTRNHYSPLRDGMYYLPISQGTGPSPVNGNMVKVNFTGSFLNGKVFESTYERGQALEFIFGEQDQVIKGVENAISLMNEGSKAKFIIPSHLAYGEEGSSTGIVPPYTSVIYEIELLKLN